MGVLEGCSHGFWKNNTAAWGPTGYTTNSMFNVTFNVDQNRGFKPDITLLAALNLTGGGNSIQAFAREAVAALLNAAHPDVNYPLTEAEVITKVNAALNAKDYKDTKGELEALNTQLPCPLDASTS